MYRLGKEFSLDKGFTVYFNAWATRKQEGKCLEGMGQYGKAFVVPSELSTVITENNDKHLACSSSLPGSSQDVAQASVQYAKLSLSWISHWPDSR